MSTANPAAPASLSFPTKLSYGLGSIAFGIKDHGFNTLLMLYYNQVIGLPASWVGLAIMLAMLVDAVADPLIGHWSDGVKSAWGRRHPFMYASAIPVAVAYFLLWMPPAGSNELLFAHLLIVSIIVRTAISCYEIPSAALLSEFSSRYEERTSLSTFRTLFFAIGTLVMAVLVFKVMLVPTPEYPTGQLNPAGYLRYASVAAVVMVLAILISTAGTHHRIPSLRAISIERGDGGSLLSGLRVLVTDRTYVSVLLCVFLFAIATGVATTLGVYISTYFWRLSADDIGTVAGGAGGGLFLALIVLHFARRFSKKRVAVSLYSVALLAGALPVLLGLAGLMPQNAKALLPFLTASYLLMTTGVLAALVVSQSMVADVADHIELKTGRRMEGLMFAAMIMTSKAVSGVGVFLSGAILSGIGFPEKADPATVDPAVVTQLAQIFVVSLTVFVILALIALSFYPITREIHEKTLRQLAERTKATT